jgi:hypothetical protein
MTVRVKALLVLVGVATLGVLGGLAATSRVSMPHSHAPGVRLVRSLSGAVKPVADGPLPRAVADEARFDFGVMDPLTMGGHTFVVRNRGDAPLLLEQGPTTCRCTLSETSRAPIPPGGSGMVKMEWNSGRKSRDFLQTADVYTNDPTRPRLRFQVTGLVRMELGADPPEIVFADTPPDESRRGEAVIYSQIHDSFSITGGEASLAGLTWRVEPADASLLEKYDALAAWRVIVDLPAGLPAGHFTHNLRLNVHVDRRLQAGQSSALPAEEPSDPNAVELAITGKVLRRLAIYGAGIDGRGVVDLGFVPRGQGKTLRLIAQIRDPEPNVEFEPAEVEPSFLKVHIAPHSPQGDLRGLYRLEIEVPRDAPDCSYFAPRYGRIKIKPRHPRVEPVELKVNMAVTDIDS